MDGGKYQPEEHEVLAEIHQVISDNPEFGSKRVASSIKSSNPDWHIGDKRGAFHCNRPRARGRRSIPATRTVAGQTERDGALCIQTPSVFCGRYAHQLVHLQSRPPDAMPFLLVPSLVLN
jgi:hypothetical protein